MKGKIVLLPFPFTDLTKAKLRPALVILESKDDVVVCFISSKTMTTISDNEILLSSNHKEFKISGLKIDSIIKLDKIATILKELIIGEIGIIGKEKIKEFNQKISKIYQI
jgi:mRNA interferase MazF